MIHTLKNDEIKITVADYGAELKSLIGADGTEYLFDGNPKWWKYTSPVLFPFVGKLVNNKYRAEGKEFNLPQHGFARTTNFECIREEKNSITFRLNWNEDTLKVYPYKFSLEISYILKKNTVAIIWVVKNIDDKTIYFSIGVKCPIIDGENFEDCYLKFNKKEKSARILLSTNGNLLHKKIPMLDGNILELNYEIFKDDALIFDDLKSDEITICSKKSSKKITLQAKNFPFLGICTPSQGGAPFICIEPWQGHADFEDFSGDITQKDGINKIEIGQSYGTNYNLIVNV